MRRLFRAITQALLLRRHVVVKGSTLCGTQLKIVKILISQLFSSSCYIFVHKSADSARRSRWSHGLRHRSWPLDCWNGGFESRWGHGCLSLCLHAVLSCVGRGLCDGFITIPKESYQVCKIYYETSRVRRPRSTRTVEPLMMMIDSAQH
jgi:hypothetical protein